MIQIQLNGQPQKVAAKTIRELVESLEISDSHLVVEHNGKILQKEEWEGQALSASDKVELISFVAGG
ncbi:MAG: hypothetical protein Kow0037_13040 [Calditrichia bacterium]